MKILEINPTTLAPGNKDSPFTGAITQISTLTKDASFPDLGALPTLSDLPLPNLDMLAGVVRSFAEMSQKLTVSPTTLVGELQEILEQIKSGSSDVGNLLGTMQDITGNIGAGVGELPTFFEKFNSDVFPVLNTLKNPKIDTPYLIQLFQFDSLAQTLPKNFNDILQTQQQDINGIATTLAPLGNQQWLSNYKAALTAVTSLPDISTLKREDLLVLNDQKMQEIKKDVNTLKQSTNSALKKLNAFNENLDTRSQSLSSSLEEIIHTIEPQNIGNSLHFFDAAIAQLDKFKLDSITGKIEGVAKAVDKLVTQNFDRLTNSIETVATKIADGIGIAKQVLVKVSAIISDLITQLKTFIAKANFSGLVKQVKAAFQTFAISTNKVLERVNQIVTKIYNFIKSIVEKIDLIDLQPIAKAIHDLISQISAFLKSPQVSEALEKATQGINQVVKQLEAVTLKPIFDQVIDEANTVKVKLEAVNVSQLNPVVKTALKTALDPIRQAIDPSTVTAAIQEEYNTIVKQQLRAVAIEPIKSNFDKLTQIIDEFQPSNLVDRFLTPPFETMVEEIKKIIDPKQILTKLNGLTKFYDSLLDDVDKKVNPTNLLTPLVKYYEQLMNFVKELSPEKLINPLNEVLKVAQNQLSALKIEVIIEQIKAPVNNIVQTVTNFQLEKQLFWQPIQEILNIKLEDLIKGFVQQIQGVINQINISNLDSILQPLSSAINKIKNQVQKSELLTSVQSLVTQTGINISKYQAEMTALADQWQAANNRLKQISPSQELTQEYNVLKQRLEELKPITLLAAPTNQISQIATVLDTINKTLNQNWDKLTKIFESGNKQIETILSGKADASKAYLNQIIDGFANSINKNLLPSLSKPITSVKGAIAAFLELQKYLDIFNKIPESLDRIGKAIIDTKNAIVGFNFNFLTDELQGLMDTVINPLEALNPKALLDELNIIYQEILNLLHHLNPADLIAAARGTVTLKRKATTGELRIPRGIRMIATTPVGEMHFETIGEVVLAEGINSTNVPVIALQGSEIVALKDVTWRVETKKTELVDFEATHTDTEPILSLTTLGSKIILQKLQALHPVKLIAEPLNEQFYKPLLELKNQLGIDQIFTALLKVLDNIDRELEDGLKRLAIALSGVLTAMPL